MNTKIYGDEGERLAIDCLKKKKYKIVATKYSNRIGEIDIVAFDGKILVFIEVKARRSDKFGTPAEAVTPYKQHKIVSAAKIFLLEKGISDTQCRFDVIEVMPKGINHIINAFSL